jgi:hypothetical protein
MRTVVWEVVWTIWENSVDSTQRCPNLVGLEQQFGRLDQTVLRQGRFVLLRIQLLSRVFIGNPAADLCLFRPCAHIACLTSLFLRYSGLIMIGFTARVVSAKTNSGKAGYARSVHISSNTSRC